MDIEQFWDIIDHARREAGDDTEARVETLGVLLAPLSADELQAFQNHYDQQISRSFRWDLWGAAYLINGGCSDDGFRYFCDWLISEGRETFEAALADPESLADLPRLEDVAELESFGYVVAEIFEKNEYGDLDREFAAELHIPDGEEWQEEDLPDLLPKIAALYGD